ncbi:MAG TPA: class I SAM-dependent methyltransferase [Ktedonobacterales bacterium]|nr:class I SAM-dependent methyltransferase [Ktedonobacterales bacterium]
MTPNAYSSLWFHLFLPLQTDESTEKDVAFLARQLPLPRYGHLLDLCCGYGRHAMRLAERGYQVTGLDRDPEAIAEAERRTHVANQQVTYLVGDMREVGELPGTFDGVINMWQSLAYFDEATNAEVLRQVRSKLTPGGRFIVDIYNRDFFERNQGQKRQEIDSTIVESDGYMEGNRWHSVLTYRDAAGALVGGDHMEWQMFTSDEFVALAAQCGFTSRLACAWADETIPPSPDVARMQIVLERV